VSADGDVLFDAPGPRARRRTRIATVVVLAVVALLVWLAVHSFAAHGQLDASRWRPFTTWPIQRFLLTGLRDTLIATAVSTVLALPLGALVALARLARTPLIRVPAAVYTEVFRSVPVLLLIYLFLLVLPRAGITLPLFWQLVVPIVISASATSAEIFRAGVLALDRGQSEAAFSIGLTYWQAMRIVVLPQVIRKLMPALVTQVISIVKDTTLGYVVSYAELLHQGQTLGEYTQLLVQTFLIVALVYVLFNGALSQVAVGLERRQRRVRPSPVPAAEAAAPLEVRLDA
jgi:glutamate transport system permease protein